jgi:cysteine desulfuration protein SufE
LSSKEVLDDFTLIPEAERLNMLLEYSESLPEPPTEHAGFDFEKVEECQSPIYLAVEIEAGAVNLYFDAPREAPTTRGFASVLHSALNGSTPQQVIEFDESFPDQLGIAHLISPLRMRGIRGMIARIKRLTRELSGN